METNRLPECTLLDQNEATEPPGFAALRASFSSEGWLDDSPRAAPHRIVVLGANGRDCLAAATVARAEQSRFSEVAGIARGQLESAFYLSEVLVSAPAEELLPALLYLALRRGRIWRRATVVACVSDLEAPAVRLLGLRPLSRLTPVEEDGRSRVVVAERTDLAIYRAYRAASPAAKALIGQQFVPEAVETLDRWIGHFFQTAWFRAVYEGTMSREQYVYTLSNMHQFVRFTTRLIARAIGFADDPVLREHWRKHLDGEVNHELIIEKDLDALGADVRYVVEEMVPSVANQQFMVTQESIIGFHQDPVLFLGAPFVAEGFSSRLDQTFLHALERTVQSWGVAEPKAVTRFFASHIRYDGGADGHWAQTRAMLERCLVDDQKLQRFLNVVHLCTAAFEHSYRSYIEDLAIFSA